MGVPVTEGETEAFATTVGAWRLGRRRQLPDGPGRPIHLP
jgi:hypothetical protein